MNIPNLLFEKHPHPIIAYDVESLEILKVNQCACITYEYTEEEFLAGTIQLICPEEDEEILRKNLDLEAQNKIMDRGTVEHVTNNGDRIKVNITTQSIEDEGRTTRIMSIRDVTHFTEMQDQLKRKRERLEKAQKLGDLGWWELDPQSGKVTWSQKVYDMLGLDHEDIDVETDFRKYVHPDDEQDLEQAKKKIRNSDNHVEYLIRLKHANGEYLHMKCRAEAVRTDGGDIELIRGVAQDSTDEQEHILAAEKAKLKLQKQKDFSDILIHNLPDIFMLMDEDGNVVEHNNQMEKITGYSTEEIDGKYAVDFFADAEKPLLEKRLKEAFSKGHTSTKGTLVTNDGQRIPHKLNGIRFNFDNATYVAGIGVDISKRIKYEKKLETKSDRLQRAKQIAQIGSFAWNVKEDEIDWSEQAHKIYGTDEETIDRLSIEDFLEFIHPGDKQRVLDLINKILSGDGFYELEHRICTPDGAEKYVKQRGQVEYDGYDNAEFVFGTVQDITEEHKQKQKIRRNEQLFESLFKDAPVAMVLGDTDENVLMANKSFEELFGYSEQVLKENNLFDLLEPENPEKHPRETYQEVLNEGGQIYYTGKRRTKSGEIKEVSIGVVPVVIDGNPIAVFGIYMDITKLKQTERDLKESLEQKEVLLSEIHHRVKNNLAIISGLLEMESYNWEEENGKVVKAFRNSQLRIQSIAKIHEMLYQSNDLANLKFSTYLREFVELILQTQAHDTESLEVDIHCDEHIKMNVNQAMPTALIINELITNALEHAYTDSDRPKLLVSFKEETANNLSLTVKDNGDGLPQKYDEHPSDSLGMTIVNQLVKQLDADFEVHQNGGTSYSLQFKKGDVSGSSSNYFV
jgi:PAS domain S-box-containing protein